MSSYSFRDLEDFFHAIDEGRGTLIRLAAATEQAVAPPAFFLGHVPAELSYAFFSETKTGAVRCFQLLDASLTADGIVIADGQILWSTMLNHPDYHVKSTIEALGGTLDSMPRRRVAGPAVMFSGPGSHIYGHWLVDILPRLYVLESCGYDIGRLQFIVSAAIPESSRNILLQLGIRPDQLVFHDERREIIDVEDLILPTNLRRGSRMHPLIRPAMLYLRRRLNAGLMEPPAAPHRRVFISRAKADPSRSLQNRSEVEMIARAAGMEIVFPETMSLIEQVQIFRETEMAVGEYGSGLHNSVFMPKGSVVMAIRGTSHHPGFIQSALAEAFGHPTGYVFCQTQLEAIHQSFVAAPDTVRLGLQCAELLNQRRREEAE